MDLKVFWNNVCLLSKAERDFINMKNERLIKEDMKTSYDFEFYGLGYEKTLSQKVDSLIGENLVDGDIIVSTDLDVFQNSKRSEYFLENYRTLEDTFTYSDYIRENKSIIDPSSYFFPFIIIPLVMIVNKDKCKKPVKSFKDLLDDDFKDDYSFGGHSNSAGHSLLKSIHYLYGEDSYLKFLNNAQVTSMPAQAFQKLMKGEVSLAIVPSIFALRGGVGSLEAVWPNEGAVAIPSYIAVRKRVSDIDLQKFINNFLHVDHQHRLRDLGDIIPTFKNTVPSEFALKNRCSLIYPEWTFYKKFDHDMLYSHINNKLNP